MIKLFEQFNNEQEIREICKEYNIENYTINSDGSIDVDGDVELGALNLNKIPLKFNNVSGYFNISSNNITSLEGFPKEVGDSVHCSYNKISTFEYFPNKINKNIYMNKNPLESLEGFYDDYEKLYCDNKEGLILKLKRSKKLKLISEL